MFCNKSSMQYANIVLVVNFQDLCIQIIQSLGCCIMYWIELKWCSFLFIPVSMRSLCGLADLRYNLDGTFFTLDQTEHCKYSNVVL